MEFMLYLPKLVLFHLAIGHLIVMLFLFSGFVSYADEDRKVFYLRMKYSLPKPGSKAKNEGYMVSKSVFNEIEDEYHFFL